MLNPTIKHTVNCFQENNKKPSLKRMAGNGITSRDFQIAFAKKQGQSDNMSNTSFINLNK